MSRAATATDLVPEPHTVLGTLLRPFTLGHHLLLRKTRLPFAAQPYAESRPDQLALGVFICAARYADHVESLLRNEWAADFQSWYKRLRPRWRRWRYNHPDEAGKFADYLADGYQHPPVWQHDGPNRIRLSSPWECLLRVRLVQGGFSEAEVMDKYLPAAWYDYHTLNELQQAANCIDAAKWRSTFYTEEDDAKLHPKEAS